MVLYAVFQYLMYAFKSTFCLSMCIFIHITKMENWRTTLQNSEAGKFWRVDVFWLSYCFGKCEVGNFPWIDFSPIAVGVQQHGWLHGLQVKGKGSLNLFVTQMIQFGMHGWKKLFLLTSHIKMEPCLPLHLSIQLVIPRPRTSNSIFIGLDYLHPINPFPFSLLRTISFITQ